LEEKKWERPIIVFTRQKQIKARSNIPIKIVKNQKGYPNVTLYSITPSGLQGKVSRSTTLGPERKRHNRIKTKGIAGLSTNEVHHRPGRRKGVTPSAKVNRLLT